MSAILIIVGAIAFIAFIYWIWISPYLQVRKEKKLIKDVGFSAKSELIIENNKKYIRTEITLPSDLQSIAFSANDQNSNIRLKPKFLKEIPNGNIKTAIYMTRVFDNMEIVVKTGMRGWEYYNTNTSEIIET